jgi:hypothetical protein
MVSFIEFHHGVIFALYTDLNSLNLWGTVQVQAFESNP